MTVNHLVVGSSPTSGAKIKKSQPPVLSGDAIFLFLPLALRTRSLLLEGRKSALVPLLPLFSFLLCSVFLQSQHLGDLVRLVLVASLSTLVVSACTRRCGDVPTVLADPPDILL